MFKKFLDGLLFGTGFGIAFITLWLIAFYYATPIIFSQKNPEYEAGYIEEEVGKEISSVPTIKLKERYLGSTGAYTRGFLDKKNDAVLSEGPGKIIGSAMFNDKPVKGLRLRLALNGSVFSQWVNTDTNGKYTINVPYGQYIIDGYELDRSSADKVLSGKITLPRGPHSSDIFEVSESMDGQGLGLEFTDPIKKKAERIEFSSSDEVIIEWEPYPGAYQYLVQVYEKSKPYSYEINNNIFPWSNRPKVSTAQINLSEHGANLKPGHFYNIEINALDERMNMLSETGRADEGYDFRIVD